MDTAKEEKIYTVEDIEALPEGERAELIDGKIYYMSSPSRIHQRISMSISTDINNYIKANKGNCEVYAAPFAVYLNNNKNSTNYFEPDIFVVCDPTKLDDKGCHGAPDWIIEIVSPSSATMDGFIKLFKYSDAGVREYWVVDPKERKVVVYKGKEDIKEYTFDDTIPVGIYDNFSIKIEV
ncbi:MAG: Uma2 family endonuclease [Ruminiclostridium sp.]|nr:Uma2 family endonuclease [Ruminiclostridium sp.]